MDDEKVLTYKDIVLRKSDLDTLRGPCYLNDQIIGFYFKYLSSIFYGDDILLVSPSLSFWLTNIVSSESAKENIEPLKLCDKNIVVFAVNNSDASEFDDSGTHWSLLAYHRDTNIFVHHNSMEGVNNEYATKLYDVVKEFFPSPASSKASTKSKQKNKKKTDFTSVSKVSSTIPEFVEHDRTPQQSNGYDCGLYVMAVARTICQWHSCKSRGKGADWFSAMEKQVTESYVEMTMRSEVIELVEDLQVQN